VPRTTASRELRSIRTALYQILRSIDRLAPVLTAATAVPAISHARPRRKLQLSPARRAALKLQGQYLGHMRGLKPRQKAQVKRIRAAKGVRAAIAAAKQLAS
jgi:hypothetical protein